VRGIDLLVRVKWQSSVRDSERKWPSSPMCSDGAAGISVYYRCTVPLLLLWQRELGRKLTAAVANAVDSKIST